jgi:hypothetical protein
MQTLLMRAAGALAISTVLATGASAAILAQWNFNADTNQRNASTGTGSLAVQGGMSFLTSLSTDASGSPGDTTPPGAAGFNHSQGMNGTATPATAVAGAAASGSVGLRVATSTAGFGNIKVSWHQAQGFRGSRYYQLFATTNGTTFSPVSGGLGSSAANLGGTAGNSWYDSLTVSNTGLVEIRVRDGKILDPTGNGMGWELSYTFPSGSAVENNPNFGVLLAAVHAPSTSDYVSSFAGTTNLGDSVKGYLRNGSAAGGGLRYDLITVSTVPEPMSAGVAALGGSVMLLRRRR